MQYQVVDTYFLAIHSMMPEIARISGYFPEHNLETDFQLILKRLKSFLLGKSWAGIWVLFWCIIIYSLNIIRITDEWIQNNLSFSRLNDCNR